MTIQTPTPIRRGPHNEWRWDYESRVKIGKGQSGGGWEELKYFFTFEKAAKAIDLEGSISKLK